MPRKIRRNKSQGDHTPAKSKQAGDVVSKDGEEIQPIEVSLEGVQFGKNEKVLPGRPPNHPAKFIEKYKNHLTKKAMIRELEQRWPDVVINDYEANLAPGPP